MLQRPVGCWRCGWRLGRRVPAWAGDGARSCHELQAQIGARKEEMEKKEEMEEKEEMGCKRSLLGRVRVVLVSPQQAGNIGSVCRVTTNFGDRQSLPPLPLSFFLPTNSISLQILAVREMSASTP